MWSRYDSAASTSIGAIVTACSHATQPAVKPAIAPNARRGNRAVPPPRVGRAELGVHERQQYDDQPASSQETSDARPPPSPR